MVDKKWVCCTVFNIVHHKSYKCLNNDSHVGHVTQGELGRHHNRLMSYLGQWVIDTMVGMDKDSSSEKYKQERCWATLAGLLVFWRQFRPKHGPIFPNCLSPIVATNITNLMHVHTPNFDLNSIY